MISSKAAIRKLKNSKIDIIVLVVDYKGLSNVPTSPGIRSGVVALLANAMEVTIENRRGLKALEPLHLTQSI